MGAANNFDNKRSKHSNDFMGDQFFQSNIGEIKNMGIGDLLELLGRGQSKRNKISSLLETSRVLDNLMELQKITSEIRNQIDIIQYKLEKCQTIFLAQHKHKHQFLPVFLYGAKDQNNFWQAITKVEEGSKYNLFDDNQSDWDYETFDKLYFECANNHIYTRVDDTNYENSVHSIELND